MEPYRTPQELVEGLHARQPRARKELFDLLRQPIERLLTDLLKRYGLHEEMDLVVLHGLHHAETHLRYRPVAAVAGLSWGAFRASLLVHVAKLAVKPHGATGNGLAGPTTLPDSPMVQYETFFRPYARLGSQFFGGDWYAGRLHDDGSIWVFLADVTGHGFYAYLLASVLPALWSRCWLLHPGRAPEPAELLAAMHDLVGDCLPEGIFLECLLTRLDPAGKMTFSPAGGARVMVRHGTKSPGMMKLRGSWLGLRAPIREDQHEIQLGAGDEVLLTTDGVFDQLEDHGGPEGVLDERPARHGSLLESFREVIERSLATEPQKDDITMVLLRYQRPSEDGPIMLPFPGGKSSAGRDDVPV
jgi:serine phosphatase RsbU (regulator of sigma subunit)